MEELSFSLALEGRDLRFLALKALALPLLLLAAAHLGRRSPRWRPILRLAAALLVVNVLLDLGGTGLSYNRPAPFGASALAPLFAVLEPSVRWPALLHAALAVAISLWALPRILSARVPHVAFAAALFALAFAAPVLSASTRPADVVFHQFFRSDFDYLPHVLPLSETGWLLDHYVEWMRTLSIHARTHGPGPLVILGLIRAAVGPGEWALALALQAIGALLPIGTWMAARGLVEEREARLAGLLVAWCPSFQHFSFVSMEAVFALGILAATACCLRALFAPRRATAWAVAGGALLYASALNTFSTSVACLLAAVGGVLGVHWRLFPARRALAAGVLAAGSFGASWAILLEFTGFDLLACLGRAIALNAQVMGSAWRSLPHGALASVGNLAAFAIACGVPVSALACVGLARARGDRSRPSWLAASTGATLGLVAVAGLYQWEVERIWLFLVAPVAIAAARQAGAGGWIESGSVRPLLLAVALQSLLSEMAFYTYW